MDFKNRITENIVKSIKSYIREAFDRKLVKSGQFFDAISTMKGDVRMCVGYITAEPLDLLPKIKKRNPETNRMKSYPDYESFGKEYDIAGTIAGIVKLTKYSGFNYVRPDDLSKRYAAARDTWNQIDSNYGLKPVDKDSKNGKYTTTQQFGNNNLKVYGGENDSIKNHSYFPQNTFGARISSTYFVINDEGNIIANLTREQLAKYIKKKNPYKVDALIKLDRSAEEIERYIKEMDAVKMRYQQFENSKILYMAAKSNELGKFAFINDRLADVIGDVKINTRQFMQIAASQYSIDIQKLDESINNINNNMRITENTLRKLVKESILKVLKEDYAALNNGGGVLKF